MKPYHVLLVEEVLHPFYIFQLLAVAFWMADNYYYYSGMYMYVPLSPCIVYHQHGISVPCSRLATVSDYPHVHIHVHVWYWIDNPSTLPPPSPLPFLSAAVFLISTVSVLVSLVQTRRHLQQLHNIVASSCTLTVVRGGRGESPLSHPLSHIPSHTSHTHTSPLTHLTLTHPLSHIPTHCCWSLPQRCGG